jgi:hypothetical protein
MALKRKKTNIGLSTPPSENLEVAKAWIQTHLLMVLLREPQTSAPEFSPYMAPTPWRITCLAANALMNLVRRLG